VIFFSVPPVQCLQPLAGEILAFKAKPYLTFPQQFTVMAHVGTILSPWNATWAIFPVITLFVYIILLKKIGDAHTTVHATGSNEVFFHHKNPLPDPNSPKATVISKTMPFS